VLYELPFGSGKRWLSEGGAAAYFLGGWQVQAVARLASGFPFTVTSTNVCQCGSFVPQRVNFAPGREDDGGQIDNPAQTRWFDLSAYTVAATGTQGTAGRNTVIGPGTKQLDFSFTKRFPLAGRTRLEFRGEIFNIFNFVNFGNPDSNISNATAGIISTADEARNVQLGFRVVW
jgi:hypothetical protein